jgi:leader peptidase (prepilin peptidase)/N-methyltransferase
LERDVFPKTGSHFSASRSGIPILLGVLGLLGFGLSVVAVPGLPGVFGGVLAVLMLAIAVSDARHFIVPNVLTAASFALALLGAALFDGGPMLEAIAACLLRAAGAALPLLALMVLYQWLRGRPGLGLGDVKLAAVAGAWLDWFAIVGAIEAAALAALVAYAVRHYALRRPVSAETKLPFGLFLAPAIWLAWLAQTVLAPS